jgi:hypothetical protein
MIFRDIADESGLVNGAGVSFFELDLKLLASGSRMCYGVEKKIRSKRRAVGDGEVIDHKNLPYGRSGWLDRKRTNRFLPAI